MKTYYLVHTQTGMIYRIEGLLEVSAHFVEDDRWLHADGFTLRVDPHFRVFNQLRNALWSAVNVLFYLPPTPRRAKLKAKYAEKLNAILQKKAQQQ